MPRVIRWSGPKGSGQRVMLATPAYQGVCGGFAKSLFASHPALQDAGIDVEVEFFTENCHVDDSRNLLVRDFLESDCTDLVFLDADIAWDPSDLVRLLQYDRDVVGATYRLKQDDEGYPVRHLPGEIWADADGLIEVEGLPTGFLRIRRNVLEQLFSQAEHFHSKSDIPGRLPVPLIFQRTLRKFDDRRVGERVGGDYEFCLLWRRTGGKLYLDPNPRFHHFGENLWTGCYGQWLKQKNGLSFTGLTTINDGDDTAQTVLDLWQEWGNPDWSATPELLVTLIDLARAADRPILECGSGLSSLVMAAANTSVDVHVLEHSNEWAEKVERVADQFGLSNLHIHVVPLVDYPQWGYIWYDIDALPELDYGLVVVDGPPRMLANRKGIFEHYDIRDAIVVMDDIEESQQHETLDNWCRLNGRDFIQIGKLRPFAISLPGENYELRTY